MPEQTHQTIRVLLTVPKPTDKTNPYVTDLVDGLRREGVDVGFLDAREIVAGAWDVVHIQWPEALTEGSTAARRFVKRVLALVMLARARMKGAPVIRTVHNHAPHDGRSRIGGWVEALLDHSTDLRIYLNEADEPRPSPNVVLLHPSYAPVVDMAEPVAPKQSIFSFGLIRPYKGYEGLINAWRERDGGGNALIAGGLGGDAAYADRVLSAAAETPGMTIHPQFMSENKLQETIRASELVVLPYRNLYNSGAAILALSLGTPVLLGRSPSTESLQDEVGRDRVVLFDGDIDADDLDRGLAVVRQQRTSGSAFGMNRNALRVAGLHASIYRDLVAAGSQGRRGVSDLLSNSSRAALQSHSAKNGHLEEIVTQEACP